MRTTIVLFVLAVLLALALLGTPEPDPCYTKCYLVDNGTLTCQQICR